MPRRSASRPRRPKPPPTSDPAPIHVVSDSTGNLAGHILAALLTQFPRDAFHVELHSFVRTRRQIDKVLRQVAARPGMVFHSVLDPEKKRAIADACRKLRIATCDLTGSFVEFIAQHSGLTPERSYQRLHHVDETYQRRISALEFTLAHDDALGLETLDQADIVLVGVSRTSKTPTSIYLAQQGFRVANVALAIELAPPRELLELRDRKVVGLVIEPRSLAEIRVRRQRAWRMGPTSYTDLREVTRELEWSRRLYEKQRWPILDVTNQAVEETAARIVHALGLVRTAEL